MQVDQGSTVARDRRGRRRDARLHPCAGAGEAHPPSALRLPCLRRCGDPGPVPERSIDGGMATEALLALVLIRKYTDHLPLYRQAQIFARHGITLDRSTSCNWVGRACWRLASPHALMLQAAPAAPEVFADDTTLRVLNPGRGRIKTGRLWCYAVDNPPWNGPGHPTAAYVYSEDRNAEYAAAHSKGFKGLLRVDGYAGFASLVKPASNDGPSLAFC